MRQELNSIYLTISVLIASCVGINVSGFKYLRYKAYECDDETFDDVKPLRLIDTTHVRSAVECTRLCGGKASVNYPLFALVYNDIENVTSLKCDLLTTIIPYLSVYEPESDLLNVTLTPFCAFYFPQGQTCDSIQGQGHTLSWINLWPNHPGVPALCDFDTDGGGWTVIQRRLDGSENFYRGWNDYKFGFGSLLGEFWFGLEKIRTLVISKPYEIRFDMRTFTGQERYAVYQNFRFENESQLYRMSVGSYFGNAGDSFSYHNNAMFDSIDKLPRTTFLCPELSKSAFWYQPICFYVSPNGLYNAFFPSQGIHWKTFSGYFSSLKFIEMKIRPID